MAVRKVMGIFAVASLLMWVFPVVVLQMFNRNMIPWIENLSPRSRTLWSGGLAVLSVNFVMAMYIVLALREPSGGVGPQPDPVFTSRANARLAEIVRNRARSEPSPPESSSETRTEPENRSKSD